MKINQLLLIAFIFCLNSSLFAQGDTIYGLNFTTGQLRFAKMDIATGTVNVLSSAPLSPDAFQQGVADFDPINKIFYYPRFNNGTTQLISVDAKTGTKINSVNIPNTNNAVASITNIAYNWLNDTLYGVNHVYNGTTQLRLVSVDPTTGALNMISSSPVSTTPYLSGNSDIDPIHRRYFYATPSHIYTVDLDNGQAIHSKAINYPTTGSGQFIVNLTYNWFNDMVYALYFSPSANPVGPYISQLQLATIDPATGNVNVLSSTALSPDGYSSGDCDIDPVSNRYFYIRAGQLYTVDLTTGNLISTQSIQNPNNAIAPITSMAYDDFKLPPTDPSRMNMGDTITIDAGATLTLDAFVGDNVNYAWSNGSTSSSITIQTPGTYTVTVTKDVFTVEGEIEVVFNTTSNTDNIQDIDFKVFPNPVKDFINVEWAGDWTNTEIILYDALGRVVLNYQSTANQQIDVSNLNSGTYILELNDGENRVTRRVVIQ